MLLGVCVCVRVCLCECVWIHNIPDPSLVKVGLVTGTVSLQGTVIHVVLFIFHPRAANHINQPALLHKHRWPTSTQCTREHTGGCVCCSFFFFFPAIFYTSVTVSRYSQENKNTWNALKGPYREHLTHRPKKANGHAGNGALWCLGKGKVAIASLPALFKSVVRQICRWAGNKRGLAVLESVDNLRREKAIGLSRGSEGIPSKASVINKAAQCLISADRHSSKSAETSF